MAGGASVSDVKNEVKFLAFCVEVYKTEKGMSGKDAYNYLHSAGATDFILDCYGALHTTGHLYIIDSIDDYIANKNCQ